MASGSQYLYAEFDTGIYNSADARPSKEHDEYWIMEIGPEECSRRESYGKWLVFKHISVIDKNWDIVSGAVASGELGAISCKVSTRKRSPISSKDEDMHVICVYTTKDDMDEVGMKLIQLVKQTIRYKTDEATLSNKYTSHGHGKVTCRTIDWNSGHPKFKN